MIAYFHFLDTPDRAKVSGIDRRLAALNTITIIGGIS